MLADQDGYSNAAFRHQPHGNQAMLHADMGSVFDFDADPNRAVYAIGRTKLHLLTCANG